MDPSGKGSVEVCGSIVPSESYLESCDSQESHGGCNCREACVRKASVEICHHVLCRLLVRARVHRHAMKSCPGDPTYRMPSLRRARLRQLAVGQARGWL